MACDDTDTIYLIDGDIDGSDSVLSKLVCRDSSAFGRASMVARLIDKVPADHVVNVVISTRGGALVAVEKILKKLKARPAGYRVYVRGECYSAGALLALGASEIVMAADSYIGKIDPQSGGQIIIYTQIDDTKLDPRDRYNVGLAQNIMNYTCQILEFAVPDDDCRQKVGQSLLYSRLPHEALFGSELCREMGLPVRPPADHELRYFDPDVSVVDFKATGSGHCFWPTVALAAALGTAWWAWAKRH